MSDDLHLNKWIQLKIFHNSVDLSLSFTYADEYQTRKCYEFYRPGEDAAWTAFWEGIRCFKFSVAMLQQFFFKYKGQPVVVENFKTFVRSAGKEGICQDTAGLFYS